MSIDRAKVIKEYEDFVNGYECFCTSDDYEYEMHKAVLTLLKEQQERLDSIVCFENGDKVQTWNCPLCKSEVRLVLRGKGR